LDLNHIVEIILITGALQCCCCAFYAHSLLLFLLAASFRTDLYVFVLLYTEFIKFKLCHYFLFGCWFRRNTLLSESLSRNINHFSLFNSGHVLFVIFISGAILYWHVSCNTVFGRDLYLLPRIYNFIYLNTYCLTGLWR